MNTAELPVERSVLQVGCEVGSHVHDRHWYAIQRWSWLAKEEEERATMSDVLQNTLKVCIVGNSRVGKSCIAERLVHNTFNERTETTNIGRAYLHKTLAVNGKTFYMNVWDTAGQERYHSLAPHYYRNASGIVLVYDITDKQSFDSLQTLWVPLIRANAGDSVALALVGNKVDLEGGDRHIATETGRALAHSLEAVFLETSAKTGDNVERIFTELVSCIGDPELRARESGDEGVDLDRPPDPAEKSSCSCHRH